MDDQVSPHVQQLSGDPDLTKTPASSLTHSTQVPIDHRQHWLPRCRITLLRIKAPAPPARGLRAALRAVLGGRTRSGRCYDSSMGGV
jgi:hypothetical protein